MPILFEESPAVALETVRKIVVALAEAHAFRTRNLQGADPTTIQFTTSHRVAELPLTSLVRESPGSVLWRGWRFIVTDKSQKPLAAAEAAQVGTDGYRFAELNEGPYVASTVE